MIELNGTSSSTCWIGLDFAVYHLATLFSKTSARVSMNGVLSESIALQRSIRQGCMLASYLYVITVDALGYLFEATRLQGQIRGIYLLYGNQLLNVHFADDLALTPELTQHSVEGTI
jgi:hypothetical protein|uniref:Reverse transcriptase domain-containing protein n=1 Tax=Picea glauca TaxID=3330 RepID=A0A101LXZ2_PICGL|nr:hypothetical protein ABT39_MTgene5570 [Picea glauca]QHR89567.1 hypothetical protein Q903MT_gene3589 [Picea sitchensis]